MIFCDESGNVIHICQKYVSNFRKIKIFPEIRDFPGKYDFAKKSWFSEKYLRYGEKTDGTFVFNAANPFWSIFPDLCTIKKKFFFFLLVCHFYGDFFLMRLSEFNFRVVKYLESLTIHTDDRKGGEGLEITLFKLNE